MTLRARLALIFSLVVAVGVAAASATSWVSTRTELHQSIEDFLENRAQELIDGARNLPTVDTDNKNTDNKNTDENPLNDNNNNNANANANDNNLDSEFVQVVTNLSFDPDAIVQVLSEDGDIVSSSGGNLPVSKTDQELAEKDRDPILREVQIGNEDFLMYTRHIRGEKGAIQVARSLKETQQALDGLRNRSLLIGAALAILAAAIGWVVTSRLTRPLRSLTVTAEHVARTQDLNTPIDVQRDDEVGSLATSFESMLAALRDSRDQQQQLIQDAGHELRTPITTLRANIELLELAPDLAEPHRSNLIRSLKSELNELTDLFNEILALSADARVDVPMDLLDLAEVADRAMRSFRTRSSRTVIATLEESRITGNAELLERAIGNLLQNADKYTEGHGDIELVVGAGALAVRDQGPGIDPADRDRIFDRFYRADTARTQPGSGLGLAIVKQIVDQHHGEVYATDAPGGGAEVGFRLPHEQQSLGNSTL